MEQSSNRNIVPVGPGGALGRIARKIVMCCTGGFVFPNVFVEGMDCTAIQKKTEANLYDKKGLPGDSAEVAKEWRTREAAASVGK